MTRRRPPPPNLIAAQAVDLDDFFTFDIEKVGARVSHEHPAYEQRRCWERQKPHFRVAGVPLLFEHVARQPGSIFEPADGTRRWAIFRSCGSRNYTPTPWSNIDRATIIKC